MDYGLFFANLMFPGREAAASVTRAAETAGFESVWTVEHVIYPDGYESTYPYDPSGKMAISKETPLPDPLVWLTYVGAVTERLRLGTGILILPQRNPVVLAKEVATLDSLSEGRVELGVGVGWLREEFEALGVPWARRGARTDEHIEALRALWDTDDAAYTGDFVSFAKASVNPKPHRGRVPIHVGGHTRAAAERAGRLGDGFFPGEGDLGELLDIMRQTAADAGRDPAGIEVTSSSRGVFGADPVGAAEELAALGVSRVMVPAFLFLQDPAAELAEFAGRVIEPTAPIAPAPAA